MLCQNCHKKTASVFISSIINGQETRTYLCNDCAKNYTVFKFKDPFSIKDIMNKFDTSEECCVSSEEENNIDIVCSNCYSTYNEYRETGKVGCSQCYKFFEKELKPILKNVYGYEEYIGKIPKRNNNGRYINEEMRMLKEDLNIAIEKEEYEMAAKIRDKIRGLEKCNE